jgi:enamine deaminase RidA (YjgF/YER057c/UK114 family)
LTPPGDRRRSRAPPRSHREGDGLPGRLEHWRTFNAIYAEALGEYRPARSVVPVPALHHGYLIELDAIAVR